MRAILIAFHGTLLDINQLVRAPMDQFSPSRRPTIQESIYYCPECLCPRCCNLLSQGKWRRVGASYTSRQEEPAIEHISKSSARRGWSITSLTTIVHGQYRFLRPTKNKRTIQRQSACERPLFCTSGKATMARWKLSVSRLSIVLLADSDVTEKTGK